MKAAVSSNGFCHIKQQRLKWDVSSIVAFASAPVDSVSCTTSENTPGYLAIPQSLKLWVADADYDQRISNIKSVSSNAGTYIDENPYTGDFINAYNAVATASTTYPNSCYGQTSSCNAAPFPKGFLHAPVPVIPFVVDTYVDTDKRLDITIDMPDIVLPNLALPNLQTPDVSIPSIITPDIIIPPIITPNIDIPDILIPDIIMPDIITPNIDIPDIIMPDIIIPDIIIPDIVVPDIIIDDIIIPETIIDIVLPDTIIPDIIIPDIIIPDIIIPDQSIDIVIPPITLPELELEIPPIELPVIEIPAISIEQIIPKVVIRRDFFQGLTIDNIRRMVKNGYSANSCLEGRLTMTEDTISDEKTQFYVTPLADTQTRRYPMLATEGLWMWLFNSPARNSSTCAFKASEFKGIIHSTIQTNDISSSYKIYQNSISTGNGGWTAYKNLNLPLPDGTVNSGQFCAFGSQDGKKWKWGWTVLIPVAPSSGKHVLGCNGGSLEWIPVSSCQS